MPDTSPEDKLLKLIRQKKTESPNSLLAQPAMSFPGGGVLTTASSSVGPHNWLNSLNTVLIFLVVAFGIFALSQLFISQTESTVSPKKKEVVLPKLEVAPIKFAESKAYSDYATTISQRDLFELPKPVVTPGQGNVVPLGNPPVVTTPPNPSAIELVKKLKLVGIVLDQTPEAIIEDMESKQTMFLQVGQSIKDAVIEQIQESKVILKFYDQRIELVQ